MVVTPPPSSGLIATHMYHGSTCHSNQIDQNMVASLCTRLELSKPKKVHFGIERAGLLNLDRGICDVRGIFSS